MNLKTRQKETIAVRRISLALIAGLLLLPGVAAAQAPTFNSTGAVVSACGATSPFAAFVAGRAGPFTVDTNGNLCISGTITITPSGTQDVNLTKVGGAAIAIGQAAMAASLPVAIASNQSTLTVTGAGGTFPVTQSTSPWIVAGGGTAGTAATGVVTVQGIAAMTPLSVSGTFFQATQPVSVASAQIASGAYASGSIGSGAIASGAVASGAVASGAFASGAVSSGAYASGSLASGAMVDLVALSAPVAPATATATKSTLLGAQATTGAVNPTNGQQGALSSDTNNNLLVSAGGAPNIATAQVSVTTGNITVAAARALRRSVKITNVTGTGAAFCGVTGVATTTGDYLGATAGSNVVYNTTAAIFCTVAATTQTVAVAETY